MSTRFAPRQGLIIVRAEMYGPLGQTRTAMLIHGYTLPAAANIDGVLGLDYLREQTLTIDFRTTLLTLA